MDTVPLLVRFTVREVQPGVFRVYDNIDQCFPQRSSNRFKSYGGARRQADKWEERARAHGFGSDRGILDGGRREYVKALLRAARPMLERK